MLPKLHFPPWLIAAVLVAISAGLQIHAIHSTYMHADEELSYHTTTDYSLPEVIQYEAQYDVHPPLWYAVFWGWQRVMGDSEFMGRLHAIFLSLLTLSLVYQIGRRWFGAPRVGLYALTLLSVNAYFFTYALDIRPYALVMLWVTCSMWAWQAWLVQPSKWRAGLYSLSITLMLYTHYYTAFIIAGQILAVVVYRRTLIWRTLAAILVGGLLWLPWFPVFVGQVLTMRQLTAGVGRGSFAIGAPTETTPQAIASLTQLSTNGWIGLYALLVLAGWLLMLRKPAYRVAIMWAFFAPATLLTINLVASLFTKRYISYTAIGLAILVGGVLAELPARIRTIGAVGLVAISLWSLPAQLPVRPPLRTIFRQVSAAAQRGDALFFIKANETEGLVRWQYRHYLSPTLLTTAVDTPEAALNNRRVWLVTTDVADAQVQAAFKILEPTHPLQTVIGDCNAVWCYVFQLLEAPPLNTPINFEARLAFWGVDVDAITREAVTTRLWWKVDQVPDTDYSIGLYLLDASGSLVAQSDGPIDNFGQGVIPTTQLKPANIYIDHRTLSLPANLREGEYRLTLAVYRWTDQGRLKLPDGSDLLPLVVLHLPQP